MLKKMHRFNCYLKKMKNLLNLFLDQKTHRKTPHSPVKIEYVINSLTQIKEVLNQLDLELQKINKLNNEKQKLLLSGYI